MISSFGLNGLAKVLLYSGSRIGVNVVPVAISILAARLQAGVEAATIVLTLGSAALFSNLLLGWVEQVMYRFFSRETRILLGRVLAGATVLLIGIGMAAIHLGAEEWLVRYFGTASVLAVSGLIAGDALHRYCAAALQMWEADLEFVGLNSLRIFGETSAGLFGVAGGWRGTETLLLIGAARVLVGVCAVLLIAFRTGGAGQRGADGGNSGGRARYGAEIFGWVMLLQSIMYAPQWAAVTAAGREAGGQFLVAFRVYVQGALAVTSIALLYVHPKLLAVLHQSGTAAAARRWRLWLMPYLVASIGGVAVWSIFLLSAGERLIGQGYNLAGHGLFGCLPALVCFAAANYAQKLTEMRHSVWHMLLALGFGAGGLTIGFWASLMAGSRGAALTSVCWAFSLAFGLYLFLLSALSRSWAKSIGEWPAVRWLMLLGLAASLLSAIQVYRLTGDHG